MSPFPRVTVPGLEVAPEIREAVSAMVATSRDEDAHVRAQQTGMARAMVRLGKPVFRRGKPKRVKTTRHSRRMQEIAVRAAYVAEIRGA